ncbi:hypothetical protein BJ742DRAFT_126691 [Cladochytrium replicatum]|nr:hypothetical protein BJ742DRAFT_126691 [Cladochytrium replicatum]
MRNLKGRISRTFFAVTISFSRTCRTLGKHTQMNFVTILTGGTKKQHQPPLSKKTSTNSIASEQLPIMVAPSDPGDLVDARYYYSGVFQLNERLFPCRVEHPFVSVSDTQLFDDDRNQEVRKMVSDGPPVKVSIPRHLMEQNVRRYRPHRRKSFDPGDSINIEAHLHSGYEFTSRNHRIRWVENKSIKLPRASSERLL